MSQELVDHFVKIVMIGDGGVGKSSILLKYTDNYFNDNLQSTIGVDFKVKRVECPNPQGIIKKVKITIWDTAGQERFRTLTSSYYRGAVAIILVYDVTRRETFDNLELWSDEIAQFAMHDGKVVEKLLVGNKIDLARSVTFETAAAWAKAKGMTYMEISSKSSNPAQIYETAVAKVLANPILLPLTISSKKAGGSQNDATEQILPTESAVANAINDSSRIGVDRLGFNVYARAISNVLSEADTPVCVGLYARWGSGKSFMIQLLKYYFDNSVAVKSLTKELAQWYEEGWRPPIMPHREGALDMKSSNTSFLDRMYFRVRLVLRCCTCNQLYSRLLEAGSSSILSVLPGNAYVVKVVWELLSEMFYECKLYFERHIYYEVRVFACSLYVGHDYQAITTTSMEDNRMSSNSSALTCCYSCHIHEEDLEQNRTETSGGDLKNREYLFVDFNAWEFSRSDELWAGLIRNIYQKVELRLSKHNSMEYFQHNGNSTTSAYITSGPIDWKRRWRVKKAKELLISYYGGLGPLRVRLVGLMLLCGGVLITIIMSALGMIPIWTQLISGVSHTLSVVAGIIGLVTVLLPSARLLYQTNATVNTSRGDVIFNEANRVQDSIGFLSRVRAELDDLFHFIREYEASTQIKLILVVFVDDLDRCLEGRNVKVLEALQLVLAIPGAPVMVFLAIDSRVIVASIEATINKSLSLRDALISGYEYMDKIVQVSFCLPESPPENVCRYVESCIIKSADPLHVAKMFSRLMSAANQYAEETFYFYERISFKYKDVDAPWMSPFNNRVWYSTAQRALTNDQVALELVLSIGSAIPSTTKLVTAYKDSLMNFTRNSALLSKEEILEDLCKSIQATLREVEVTPFPQQGSIEVEGDIVVALVVVSPFIVSGQLRSIICWELRTRKATLIINQFEGHLRCISVSKDASTIVSGHDDGFIRIWNMQNGEPMGVLECSGEKIFTVEVTDDNAHCVWGSSHSTCSVFNISSKTAVFRLGNHCGSTSICFFDQMVFTGCMNNPIKVWNQNCKGRFAPAMIKNACENGTFDVIFEGDIDSLNVPSELLVDGTLLESNLILVENMSVEANRYGSGNYLQGVITRCRDDGTYDIKYDDGSSEIYVDRCSIRLPLNSDIIGVTEDEISIEMDHIKPAWSVGMHVKVNSLKESAELVGHTMGITALCVLKERKQLFSSSEDATIRVWDIAELKCIRVLTGHTSSVTSIVMADNSKLVSCSMDQTIRVWNIDNDFIDSSVLRGHTDSVTSVGISLDKTSIISGSHDGFIRVWPLVELAKDESTKPPENVVAVQTAENVEKPKTITDVVRRPFTSFVEPQFNDLKINPLLPIQMHDVLTMLCKTSESNPRRLKRVLNVVLIAYEVAKYKADSISPEKVIVDHKLWPIFSARLTKWIFLCELYPYRMSFLVQLLNDLEQKRLFNNQNEDIKRSAGENAFFYGAMMKQDKVSSLDDVERALLKTDDMSVGEFYFLHVEKFLYTIGSAEKLMRLDGDPELFSTLIYAPINTSTDQNFQIRCVDILGPHIAIINPDAVKKENGIDTKSDRAVKQEKSKTKAEFDRDKNFSLMAYAFNLNPSMAKQISIELQDITTEYELMLASKQHDNKKESHGSDSEETKVVQSLLKGSTVYSKKDLVRGIGDKMQIEKNKNESTMVDLIEHLQLQINQLMELNLSTRSDSSKLPMNMDFGPAVNPLRIRKQQESAMSEGTFLMEDIS